MSTIQEQKFVSFKLNNEYFGLGVFSVTEVFTTATITEIPQAPDYVAGVINYRGSIVTCIDLKKRLMIEDVKVEDEYDDLLEEDEARYYIIIVKAQNASIGLLVDYVEAVIGIEDSKIQSGIDLITGNVKAAFLAGIAQVDLGLIILLSLEALLSEYDISEIEKFAELREKLAPKVEDEIVVESDAIVDLEKDDITEWEDAKPEEFKKIKDQTIGEGELDLEILTKAELLKIAIEMKLEGISTRSTKADIIVAIQGNLG